MQNYPELILKELNESIAQVSLTQCRQIVEHLTFDRKQIISGVGRSGYVARGFAMRLMQMGFSSYMLGDCNTPGIQKNDNLIIISASGRTSSLLIHAKKAKEMGAKILLLTTSPNSPIGELADAIIRISAPSPKVMGVERYHSLLPMGTLAEQTMAIVLDSLVLYLMEKFEITSDEMFARHANLE